MPPTSGSRNNRPPPASMFGDDPVQTMRARFERNSGASVSGMNYNPEYMHNVSRPPEVLDQVSDAERKLARFETTNNGSAEALALKSARQKAVDKVAKNQAKIAWLRKQGYGRKDGS